MLDQLRRDMQQQLDNLLSEADKLRQALAALGSHGSARSSAGQDRSSATRSRRTSSPRAPKAASPVATALDAPTKSQTSNGARAASGETKRAVLAALGNGTAMTAGDVAKATGLGRASVSTTLSKLAKSGEITKVARGYELAS